MVPEKGMLPGEFMQEMAMEIEGQEPAPQITEEVIEDLDFGSWMMVARRRGRGRGHEHG